MTINHLIAFAIEKRWFVMAMTLLLAVLGIYKTTQLPIDAVPDITNVQVL